MVKGQFHTQTHTNTDARGAESVKFNAKNTIIIELGVKQSFFVSSLSIVTNHIPAVHISIGFSASFSFRPDFRMYNAFTQKEIKVYDV
jgi:hypothetical protein